MRVGILTGSISRMGGGLFWSVRSLAKYTQERCCSVHVFSVIDEFSREDSTQWQGVDLHLFPPCGPKSFGYTPGLRLALGSMALDLVHTHSLWMYPSVAAWRWSSNWGRPLVVSPHGMLDSWAVSNSAWKKRIAGALYEDAHLRCAACLHALCESEYRAIRNYGLSNPVAIIPNGVELAEMSFNQLRPNWSADLPPNSRVLLFLGRMHPKKGLVNLIHAWAIVRKTEPLIAEPWHLVIAGWDQGGHQAQLECLVKDLGVGRSVHFVGPQFDEPKAACLLNADAFVLPSFSEGLPMSVLEAWSYRLPVLMTPQCNLPVGFSANAALEMEPEVASIADTLARLFSMPESERRDMGLRGRSLVEKYFTWPNIAAQMCDVYRWVLGAGPRPECVITD